jgi:hypothetical protein
MPVDLQSMTWSHFQGLAIQHQPPMARLLGGAHNTGALVWQAFIMGNVQFSQKNKLVIRGPQEFREFANQAYHEFPNRVTFKILMVDPGNVAAKGPKVRHSFICGSENRPNVKPNRPVFVRSRRAPTATRAGNTMGLPKHRLQ